MANAVLKNNDEMSKIKEEMNQMRSIMTSLQQKLKLIETKSCDNQVKYQKQFPKSNTDKEVEITRVVMSGKAELPKSSNEQNIQKEDRVIKCKFCDNKYKTEKMLQRHINTKHDDKKLCDICSERFQSAEEIVNHRLSRHTISHTVPYANNITVDTHDCELCGFKYTTDIKMRTHKIC
jgi:hypothetical protein